MSAVLSEAETKFFSSGGSEVDPSLKPIEAPTEPAKSPLAAVPSVAQPATPAAEPAAPQQVPLAALHEERQKRARVEQERQQYQQQLQQMQAQLEQLQKAQQPPPPDPNQDPIGAVLYQTKQQQAELEQLRQWRAENDQITQQLTQQRQFHQSIAASEQAFVAKQPDYYQALNYAKAQYDKMLQRVIPDPAARAQRVLQEALGVAWTVMQQGSDPAQFFYDFAKDMGYAGPQPTPSPTIPAPAIPAQQPTSEVVKTIERGLKQQGNPGGGGSPNSEITPEMALALPGEDFNKWWSKQFRR